MVKTQEQGPVVTGCENRDGMDGARSTVHPQCALIGDHTPWLSSRAATKEPTSSGPAFGCPVAFITTVRAVFGMFQVYKLLLFKELSFFPRIGRLPPLISPRELLALDTLLTRRCSSGSDSGSAAPELCPLKPKTQCASPHDATARVPEVFLSGCTQADGQGHQRLPLLGMMDPSDLRHSSTVAVMACTITDMHIEPAARRFMLHASCSMLPPPIELLLGGMGGAFLRYGEPRNDAYWKPCDWTTNPWAMMDLGRMCCVDLAPGRPSTVLCLDARSNSAPLSSLLPLNRLDQMQLRIESRPLPLPIPSCQLQSMAPRRPPHDATGRALTAGVLCRQGTMTPCHPSSAQAPVLRGGFSSSRALYVRVTKLPERAAIRECRLHRCRNLELHSTPFPLPIPPGLETSVGAVAVDSRSPTSRPAQVSTLLSVAVVRALSPLEGELENLSHHEAQHGLLAAYSLLSRARRRQATTYWPIDSRTPCDASRICKSVGRQSEAPDGVAPHPSVVYSASSLSAPFASFCLGPETYKAMDMGAFHSAMPRVALAMSAAPSNTVTKPARLHYKSTP
ncbi:hypothetical protein G7046_g3561 [Stylonectria norvegica]|nr:hypothetical protein G7046_g3561 [Stylonectria norvegica]